MKVAFFALSIKIPFLKKPKFGLCSVRSCKIIVVVVNLVAIIKVIYTVNTVAALPFL
jgi:hypothetical protein